MIPLEDTVADIVGKAQRGLRISDDELARKAGLSRADLDRAKGGSFDEALARKIARPLNLGADALAALGRNAWTPRPQQVDGLACFNTPFGDMTVNAYLVWDAATKSAAAFDTGSDCDTMLQFAKTHNLKIEMILLTHVHTDHVYDLDRLKAATHAKAHVSKREPLHGAESFADGHVFTLGGLTIDTRRTSGHARGGVTYIVTGLSRRLAVVGDALFAGSMGGGLVDYGEALRTNRENVLSLPDDTVICPGHGPLTTVGEEKRQNPFFSK